MHAIAKRIYTTALLLFLIPLLIGHLLATRHRTSPGYQLSMRHKHDVSYPLCHAWEVFCKKKTGEDQQKLILQSKLFTSLFYFHSNICEKHRTPISRELTESIVRENGFKKSSKIPLKKNERFYSLIESANNKNFRIKPDSKAESKKEFKRAVNTIDFSNHRSKPKYGPAFPIPEINIDDIKTQTNQDGVDTASFDYPSINKNIGDLNILKNKPSIPQMLIRPEKVDDNFKTYESTSTDKTDLLTKNLNADNHVNLNIPQYNDATLYSFTTSPMRDLDLTNRKTDKGNPEIKNARDFFPLKINTNHAVVLTNLLSSSSPELVSVSVNQELLNGKTYLNTPHPSFINNKINENESSTETNTSIASDDNQYNSINKDVIRNFSVGTHLLSTISVPLNAVTSENKTENGTTKNTLEINNRNNKFDAREPRPSIKQNNHISENSESINVKFTIDYGGSPNYRKQETSIPYNSKGLQSKDTLKWNSGNITRVKVNLATDLSTHANVIYQTPKYDSFNSLYETTAEYKDKLDSADYRSNPQNVLSSKLNFEKDENELFETRENNGILLFPSKPYKVSDHLKGSYSFHVIPTLSSFNNFETISTNGFVSEIENSKVKTESLFLTSFFKNENNFDESYDYSIISSTKVYTDIINDASTTIHLDYETRIFNSKIHQNTEREYRDFPHSIESVNSELIINTKVEDEGYDYSIIHVIPTLSSFNETNFQTVSTNAFVSEIENSKLKTDSLSLTNFYKNENDFDEGYDYSIISPTKVYTDIINDASTTIHLDYETRIFNSKIHQNTERVYRDLPHSIESVNSELIINTKVEDEGYDYSIIHVIPTLSSFNETNFQTVSTNAFVSEIENSKLKTDSLSLTNFYKNENDFDEGYDYSIISPTKVYTDINNDASTTIHLDYETRIFNSKIHQNTERVYRDFPHSIENVNSELIINMKVEVEGNDYSIIHAIPTLSSFNEMNFQTVSTNAFVSEIENSKLKTDSLSLTNFYKNENDFDEGYDYSIISPTKVYTDIINDASTTIHLDYETRIFNSKIHQNTEIVYRDFPHSIESVNSELIINMKVEVEGNDYSIIHAIPTLSSFNEANFQTVSTNAFVSEIENSKLKTDSLFLTNFNKNENDFDEGYDYSIISPTKVYTDIINNASTTIHLDYETRIFNSKIHQNTERVYRDFPHSIESVNSELIINTKVEVEGYNYSIIHAIPTLLSFNEANFQAVSTNAFVSEIENSKLKTDSLFLTNFYRSENDFDEGYDYSILSPTKVYTDVINDAPKSIHHDYETQIFYSNISKNTGRVYRDFSRTMKSVNSEHFINKKFDEKLSIEINKIKKENLGSTNIQMQTHSSNSMNLNGNHLILSSMKTTNKFSEPLFVTKFATDFSLNSLLSFTSKELSSDEYFSHRSIFPPTIVYTPKVYSSAVEYVNTNYKTTTNSITENIYELDFKFNNHSNVFNSLKLFEYKSSINVDNAKDSATQSVQHSPKSPFENKISQSFKVNNDNTIYSNNENNIKSSFSFERNSFGAENIVLSSVIKTTDLKSELLFPTHSYYNTEDNNKMPMSSAFKYFKTPTKTANTFSFSKIRSSINSDDYFYKSYTNYKESEYYSTSSHLVLFTESREYTFAPMQTENYLKFRTEREIESSSDGQHHFITEISSGNEIRKTAIDTEATEQGIENSLSRNPTVKTNNSYNRQISMTERNLGAREYKIQASAVNHLNVDKTNYADDQIIRTKKYLEATEREIEISAANDHDLYVKNSSADHNIRTEIDFEGTEQEVRTLVASDSNVYYESTPDKQILRTETDFETTEQEFKFLPADDQNVDDGNSSDEEIVRTERDLNAIEREEKTSPDDDQNIDDGNSSDEEIVRTERDLNSVEREEKTSPDDDQNMNVKKPSDDEFVTEKYLETENALNPTININVDVELNSEPVIQPGVEYVPSVEYVSQTSGSTNTLESNENPILTINRKPETIGSNLGISTEFQIGSDFDISSQTVPGELHKTAGTIIPNVNLEISKPIYGIDSTLGIKNNVDAQVSGGININGEGVTVDTNFKVSKAGSDFNTQLLPEELRNTASISIPSVNLDISPAKNSYGIDSKLGIGNSVNIQVGGGINLDGNGVSLDTDVKLGEDSSNINGNIDINLASDPSAQRSSSPENRGSSVNEMSANEESVTEETLLSNEVSIAPSTKLFDENKVTTQVILPSITKQIPMADTPEIILNSNDEDEDISYQATEVINAENTISTIISTEKLIPIEATENVPDAQKAETTNYKNILSTTSTGNVFNSEASTESLSPSVPSNVVLNSAPGRNQRDSESSVTTSRVQSTVAATTEIPVIPFHFTIDADYDEVVGTRKTEFEESLTKQLGVAMRVPLNCIQNLEVKKGSIEVNFDLSPNSDHGHLADEKALKAAAEELKRLIDNGQLNVNDLNGNTMVVVPLDPPTKPPPTNSMEHTTLILGVIIGAFILIVIVVAITAIIVKRKSIEDQNRLTPIEEARSKLPSYREIQFQEALFMKGPKGQQKLMFGKYCYNTGQWVGPGPEPMLFQAPESVVYRPPTDSEIRQTPRPPTSVRERLKQNWEVDWDSMVSSR